MITFLSYTLACSLLSEYIQVSVHWNECKRKVKIDLRLYVYVHFSQLIYCTFITKHELCFLDPYLSTNICAVDDSELTRGLVHTRI